MAAYRKLLLRHRINEEGRDFRAKAATNKEDSKEIHAAQAQLGHTTTTMTAHYVRHRKGKWVDPTK